MATLKHGRDGYVYVGGTIVAGVDAWSADFGYELQDVSAMDGTQWQRQIVGMKSVSGDITVWYATDDTTGQTILQNNAFGGSAVVLRLYPAGTVNYWSGTAYLTLKMDVSHADPISTTYTFESEGPWAYT